MDFGRNADQSFQSKRISFQIVPLRTRHPQTLSSFLLQPDFLRCIFRIFDFSLVSLVGRTPNPCRTFLKVFVEPLNHDVGIEAATFTAVHEANLILGYSEHILLLRGSAAFWGFT